MNLRHVTKDIDTLEESCAGFLTIDQMSDDTKDEQSKAPTFLQIRAFDSIVQECKHEINTADEAKMSSVLQLLFGIATDPLDFELIAETLEAFIKNQIDVDDSVISEGHINELKKIVSNIDAIIEILAVEYKNLISQSMKWYVFNGGQRKKLELLLRRLMELKGKVEKQMEYDSKELAKSIIDNFYNTYIFFSFLIRISTVQNKQMLLIEIANCIDRYINVIEPIFNHRRLQSQDMLYHYIMYEFKELKAYIFETLEAVA